MPEEDETRASSRQSNIETLWVAEEPNRAFVDANKGEYDKIHLPTLRSIRRPNCDIRQRPNSEGFDVLHLCFIEGNDADRALCSSTIHKALSHSNRKTRLCAVEDGLSRCTTLLIRVNMEEE